MRSEKWSRFRPVISLWSIGSSERPADRIAIVIPLGQPAVGQHLLDDHTQAGIGPAGRALAAALAQPWADAILSGAVRPEHFHSNLAALHVGWDEDVGGRLQALVESPQEYWARRTRLPWN